MIISYKQVRIYRIFNFVIANLKLYYCSSPNVRIPFLLTNVVPMRLGNIKINRSEPRGFGSIRAMHHGGANTLISEHIFVGESFGIIIYPKA